MYIRRTVVSNMLTTGQVISGPLKGHNGFVFTVTYSPDGKHIVSGSSDSTICIWNVETGHMVSRFLKGHNDSVWSVAYSPNGKHIVSGSSDKTICIWDAETEKVVSGPLKGHNGDVFSVAYSPDGKHIVSGSHDKTILIWDAETGQVVSGPLKGHNGPIRSVTYCPDGNYIVSSSSDNTICIWDTNTGVVSNDQFHTVTCFLDNKDIVSSSGKEHLLVDMVVKHKCNHQNYTSPPTTQPNCHSCTWGFTNDSRLSSGWISGPNSELIFWVPHRNRDALLIPSIIHKLGVPVPTKIFFDQFVQGDLWTECLTQHWPKYLSYMSSFQPFTPHFCY